MARTVKAASVADLAALRRIIMKSFDRADGGFLTNEIIRTEQAMGRAAIVAPSDQVAALKVLLDNEGGFSDNSSLAIVEALLAGAKQNARREATQTAQRRSEMA